MVISGGLWLLTIGCRALVMFGNWLAYQIGVASAKEREQDRRDRERIFRALHQLLGDQEIVDMMQHNE